MGTVYRLPETESGYLWTTGRTDVGRSFRSSPTTGKPSAWRRETEDR